MAFAPVYFPLFQTGREHRGGLGVFLLKAKESELSLKAVDLKRQIAKRKLADAPVARRARLETRAEEFWGGRIERSGFGEVDPE